MPDNSVYISRNSWTWACCALCAQTAWMAQKLQLHVCSFRTNRKKPVGRVFTFRCHSILAWKSDFQTKAHAHPAGSENKELAKACLHLPIHPMLFLADKWAKSLKLNLGRAHLYPRNSQRGDLLEIHVWTQGRRNTLRFPGLKCTLTISQLHISMQLRCALPPTRDMWEKAQDYKLKWIPQCSLDDWLSLSIPALSLRWSRVVRNSSFSFLHFSHHKQMHCTLPAHPLQYTEADLQK